MGAAMVRYALALIWFGIKILFRSGPLGTDLFLLLITGYAAWNLIDSSPEIIFGGELNTNTALLRFFAQVFHWLVLPIIAMFGAGFILRAFPVAAGSTTERLQQMKQVRLNSSASVLQCVRDPLFWYVAVIYIVKGAALLAIAYYSALAEYAARGNPFVS
jgi:hypothetical protein